MIRTASLADLPDIRELLKNANDAPYDLAIVAEEKCFGVGVSGAPSVRVFSRHGRIVGVAVSCGKWLRILAVERAVRRQGIGTALLEDAQTGVIAAEPGNYFTPGVWTEDRTTQAFLHARGYAETQSAWNLHLDLATTRRPDESPNLRRAAPGEKERVLDFIEREFGAVWSFEVARAFERDTPPIFIGEEEGAIVGFAAHDLNNRGLGFFGPAGVAEPVRGRGIGCRLVLASLSDLQHLGYTRAVVPWTNAVEFYRQCAGAESTYRFVAFTRSRP